MAYNYPLVMGHEFVGKVIETGSKANKFEKEILFLLSFNTLFNNKFKKCVIIVKKKI